jgi:hypothetical protein
MSEVTESATLQNLVIIRADLANGAPSYDSLERLKYVEKYIQQLSDDRVALKAENEAAVKNMAALQSELAAFKNWQPSDPGTKEAMEWAETLIANPKDYGIEDGPAKPHLESMVRSTRAAMVRLEEAEKGREKAEAFKTWTHAYLDNKGVPITVEDEHLAAGCRIGGRMDWVFLRFAAAEYQVASLTASLATRTEERDSYLDAVTLAESSLASVTKERDREIDALQEEAETHKFTTEMYATQCKQSWKESLRAESAEASLAELRKRMGEAETLLRGEQEGGDCGPGEV